MKRFFALFLCFVLIFVLAVPASAANESGWVELLEEITIQPDGENIFRMGSSYTLKIPTPREMRIRRIDMLIRVPSPHPITSASCTVNSTVKLLEVYRIGDNLVRIIGELPDATYETINISLKRSGTSSQPYEVLSCKVTPLLQQEFVADAEVYLESYGDSGYYSVPEIIYFWRDGSGYYSDSSPWMARVHVYDWQKFDSLSVWGSANGASIESIRASVGTTALDYTCNFIDVESGESFIDGDPAASVVHEFGKYMFNLTIDLSNVDRTNPDPLYVYFSGSYDITVLTTFNCQYVNGSVTTADTTNAGWKQWANKLYESVDSLPERIAEAIGSMYQPDQDKLDSAADQAQDLAEDRLGAVAQAGSIIDGLAGAFTNQSATQFLTVPVLTVPLAGVDWTIGGWNVQVVPDAFKPVVETLKIVIDIVCTLSFLNALRNRFEKLLAGGNA